MYQNEKKENGYGKCNPLVVSAASTKPIESQSFNHLETTMQTEIEILETRENTIILWM
jgi:hypothetical protein